jgi:hypothetical protein
MNMIQRPLFRQSARQAWMTWVTSSSISLSGLLKNAHLLRFPHPSSLRRTSKYASFLRISGALHLGIFEQPAENDFFSNLLVLFSGGLSPFDPALRGTRGERLIPIMVSLSNHAGFVS